jgi:hypothetical protein
MRNRHILFAILAFSLIAPLLLAQPAFAHAIGGKDAEFVRNTIGADPFPFMYLGAKHMVTGYDHLLFLTGVIFFLYRLKDVLLYVTLFSLGHSTTLILGVLFDFGVSAHLVDMIIGLSVSYKAFDNLGGFRKLGWPIDNRIAVGGFGLIHGLGLATKLQDLGLNQDGLLANLIANPIHRHGLRQQFNRMDKHYAAMGPKGSAGSSAQGSTESAATPKSAAEASESAPTMARRR